MLQKAAKIIAKSKNEERAHGSYVATMAQIDSDETGFCALNEHKMALTTVDGGIKPFDVLLDSGSTVSVFHQKSLLTNIRKSDKPVKIIGVGKSMIETYLIGDIHLDGVCLGTAYYHPDCLANLLCFFDMNRLHKVRCVDKNSY